MLMYNKSLCQFLTIKKGLHFIASPILFYKQKRDYDYFIKATFPLNDNTVKFSHITSTV